MVGAYCGGELLGNCHMKLSKALVLLIKPYIDRPGKYSVPQNQKNLHELIGLCRRERSRTNWHIGRIIPKPLLPLKLTASCGGVNLWTLAVMNILPIQRLIKVVLVHDDDFPPYLRKIRRKSEENASGRSVR